MRRLIDVIVAVGILAGVAARAEDVAAFGTVKAGQIDLGGVTLNAWPAGGTLQSVVEAGSTVTNDHTRVTLLPGADAAFAAEHPLSGIHVSLLDTGAGGRFWNSNWDVGIFNGNYGLRATFVPAGLTTTIADGTPYGILSQYNALTLKGINVAANQVLSLSAGSGSVDLVDDSVGRAGKFTGPPGTLWVGDAAQNTILLSDPTTPFWFRLSDMGNLYAGRFGFDSSTVTLCDTTRPLTVTGGDSLFQRALTTYDATNGQEVVNFQTMAGYVGLFGAGVTGGRFEMAWNGPTCSVYAVSSDSTHTNKIGDFYPAE